LGASQQLLCPSKIFSIICLLIFLVSPSYKYSTMLEFLHSTINVHTYNPYLGSYSVSLRFSLQSSSLDLRCAFYFFTFSIYLVFVSGSQFQLHSILTHCAIYNIYSPTTSPCSHLKHATTSCTTASIISSHGTLNNNPSKISSLSLSSIKVPSASKKASHT